MAAAYIRGKAHVYGDHIDTDAVIAGKYTKTLDLKSLAEHVLEDLDPQFRTTLRPGDILVAGINFGCGSSREQAPLALKAAGVAAVAATSFARIFFRNAINIGLPVLEVAGADIATGDELVIDIAEGTVENRTRGRVVTATRLPPFMLEIVQAGGLAAYLKKNGDYRLT